MKALVIGGVAAGMSAASKLMRVMPDADVTVYERGSFLAYGACGIPYFIGGVNSDPNLLIARSQEAFEKQGIKTKLRHEVIGLEPQRQTVLVRNLDTDHVFEDNYDKLMIAVGCDSAVPRVPGADLSGVFYLKSMEDGLLLEKIVTMPGVESAVIVGGGYIGVEMAEALLERNISVTLVEAQQRLLTPFEPPYSQMAAEELTRKGVRLLLGHAVSGITTQGNQRTVITSQQQSVTADMVIMAAGVVPATGFLQNSGIQLARNGAVVVDRQMRTSLENVYAAGDCAVVYNRITQEDFFLPLGTVANKCGRIAGANMAGGHETFVGALGTAAIKVCDIEMLRTGMSEADAQRLGIEYATNQVTAPNLPAYYPGQEALRIQLLYHKGSGRLLGANIAGPFGSGAVTRGNLLAVAIHAGLCTEELGMVDLGYAPPFTNVWDPVLIAANAAK